jgi:hypothetical protein
MHLDIAGATFRILRNRSKRSKTIMRPSIVSTPSHDAAQLPTPFSVTAVLLVPGPSISIGNTTEGAVPLAVGLKIIAMLAVAFGCSAKELPATL